MKFFNYGLCQLAAFTTLTSHTEFSSQICHITGPTATEVANLVVSNLSANTNVHSLSSAWDLTLNDNENDCQQHLYLLVYQLYKITAQLQ